MAFPDEALREMAALSGVVLGQPDLLATLTEITRIAVRALPPCDGASVTTSEQGRPATVAYDDDWARELDEMQYVEREGPCLDAWRLGKPFRVRDLEQETRWPSYRPRAVDLGARSSMSLPLSSDGGAVGALNCYSRSTDAFQADVVSLGEVIAAHASLAYQVATAFFGQRDLAAQLREAMESRAVIEQAKGILMVQAKLTAEAAFEVLTGLSQQRNIKLRDIAQSIVDTGSSEQPSG